MEMAAKKQTLMPYALLLIFLILATGIIWAGYFYYRLYENHYRLEVERELSAIGELKAGELTKWRRERLGDARVFYKNLAFSNLVQRTFENPRDTVAQIQLRAWLGQLQAYDQYDRLFLLDDRAEERLSIPDTREPIYPLLKKKTSETLESGEVTMVDFHRNAQKGTIHLTLLVPIFDTQRSDRVLGVLGLDIDPEKYLYPFIKRWPTWSRTAETLLVRREGSEGLYLNNLRFQADTALNLRFSLGHQDLPATKAVLGQTGIVEGRDYHGDRCLADIRPIPDSPWFLVARMDIAEVYAPLKEKQKIMIVLIGALLLLVGTGLGLLWRHQRALYYRAKYKASEALQEGEARFQNMFLKHMAVMLLIEPQSGAILDANPAAEQFYGYPLSRLRTMNITDINMLPADQVAQERQRALQEQHQYFIFPHRLADGRIRTVEVRSSPFLFKNQPALFSIIHDITEREQATDALKESELRFKTQYQGNPTPTFTWRKEGEDFELFDFNDAAKVITEGKVMKFVGKRASQLYAERPDILRDLQQCLVEKKIIRREIISGHFVPDRLIVITMVFVPPDLVMVHLEDITERKQAEAERLDMERKLLQTQKLESLGILAGGIAHDFNNMLMVVLGNADLALEALSTVSPAHPMLMEIKKIALRAAELCKQMLAYAGKGAFFIKPIDLSKLVEEMGRMLEISISKKALLRYDLSEKLPAIRADAAQVRQVVMNLIINASEAIGGRGGIISVRTGYLKDNQVDLKEYPFADELAKGPYVFLEVADTGCGMDSATLAKIFDPFFTTKFTGRGLGLPAVLGIVRGHKGALKIDSAPGQGTFFRILFPAVETAAETTDSEWNGKETWKGEGLILLVDDEELVRSLCRRMLEHIGFEVLTAGDGREALEVFKKHGSRIRCVLLDLTMPYMDGGEAFTELRRLDPGVRVILCSGYNEQTLIHQFFEKGLSGFIQKPYQLNDLKMKLKSVLA